MGVTRMNEECLKLRDHTAGYQTVQDIQRVVTEAIGGRAALSSEQLIDEVMVSCFFSAQLPACAAVCHLGSPRYVNTEHACLPAWLLSIMCTR